MTENLHEPMEPHQIVCPACGHVNAPERDTCAACDEDLQLIKAALANAGLHYNEALQLTRRGDLPAAEREALTAIEYWSGAPSFHLLLGRIYAQRGLYDLAMRAWEAAIELDPDSHEAYSCIRRGRRMQVEVRDADMLAPWRWGTGALAVLLAVVLCLWLGASLMGRRERQQAQRLVHENTQLAERNSQLLAGSLAGVGSVDSERLRQQVAEQQDEINSLKAQRAEDLVGLQEARADLAVAETRIATMEAILEQLRLRADSAEEHARQAEEQLVTLRSRVAEEEDQRHALDAQRQEIEVELKAIQATLALAAPDDVDGATAAAKVLQQQGELREALASARVSLASAEAERDSALHRLENLDDSPGDHSEELDSLRDSLAQSQAELAQARETISQAEAQAAGAVEAATTEHAQAVAALNERIAALEQQSAAVEGARREVEMLRAAIDTFATAPIDDAVKSLSTAAEARQEDRALQLLLTYAENERRRTQDPDWAAINARYYYDKANGLYRDGEMEEALRLVDIVLTYQPGWRDADRLKERIIRSMSR